MTLRPYPSVDRARRQLERHVQYEDVPVVAMQPEAARMLSQMLTAMRGIRLPAFSLFPAAPSDPGSGT